MEIYISARDDKSSMQHGLWKCFIPEILPKKERGRCRLNGSIHKLLCYIDPRIKLLGKLESYILLDRKQDHKVLYALRWFHLIVSQREGKLRHYKSGWATANFRP